MNKVAARRSPLPKNLKMIFKSVEVEDGGGADNGDKVMQDRYDIEGLKIVSDAGSSLPGGMDSEPTVIDCSIIGIHDSIDAVTDHSQQMERTFQRQSATQEQVIPKLVQSSPYQL
jgi:hypothetical protein